MDLKVVKRDGSEEEFDIQKVVKVVKAAGLNNKEAQELSNKLKKWASECKREKVTSLEIRDEVLKDLEKINKYAAGLYRWYQKTKET